MFRKKKKRGNLLETSHVSFLRCRSWCLDDTMQNVRHTTILLPENFVYAARMQDRSIRRSRTDDHFETHIQVHRGA